MCTSMLWCYYTGQSVHLQLQFYQILSVQLFGYCYRLQSNIVLIILHGCKVSHLFGLLSVGMQYCQWKHLYKSAECTYLGIILVYRVYVFSGIIDVQSIYLSDRLFFAVQSLHLLYNVDFSLLLQWIDAAQSNLSVCVQFSVSQGYFYIKIYVFYVPLKGTLTDFGLAGVARSDSNLSSKWSITSWTL